MCKLLYHFRLFYSVAVLASLAGCMKDSDADMAVFMSEIEISGKVYDFDSGAFSGVENMMVVLSSFETEDRLCEYPISRDTAYTDHAGAFSIETVCMSEGWKLRLTAKDNMSDRPGGSYHLTSAYDPILHVEFNRHTFDPESGVYRMDSVSVPVTRH